MMLVQSDAYTTMTLLAIETQKETNEVTSAIHEIMQKMYLVFMMIKPLSAASPRSPECADLSTSPPRLALPHCLQP